MAPLDLLVHAIQPAAGHGAWHGGPTPIGALRGVGAEEAWWRPAPRRKSIWMLTLHIAYWKYAIRRVLDGSGRGGFPRGPSNWPPPPDRPDAALKYEGEIDGLANAAKNYQSQLAQVQEQKRIIDRAETLGNFALSAVESRDWPRAISLLTEAIDTCGQCHSLGELRKNLGLIYCRSGDLESGEKELRAALALKPGDPDIVSALRTISDLRAAGKPH